jgi:hypothetical protein
MNGSLKRTCVALAFLFALTLRGQNYSRTEDFPALRMNYEQLQQAIEGIRAATRSGAPGCGNGTNVEEYLTLTFRSRSTTLGQNFTAERMSKAMPRASQITYRFFSPSCPVHQVDLNLNDTYRQLRVQGLDSALVDGVAAQAQMHFAERHSIGGGLWRLAGLMISVMCISPLLQVAYRFVKQRNTLAAWTCVIFAVGIPIAIVALPWSELLPGFIVLSGDANALVQYGPELSLLGLLLSITPLIVGLFKVRQKAKPAKRRNKSVQT